MKQNKKIFTILGILGLFLVMGLTNSFAELELERIYYDPAIIGAGDVVDIVIEYQSSNVPFDSSRLGAEEYAFEVRLLPDDDMTKNYVTILDSSGDPVRGQVLGGVKYNTVFRVKVSPDAPTGPYQFKLEGQWIRNGVPQGLIEEAKFEMDVKKEGIIMDISSLTTNPSKVRPGDNSIEILTHIDNSGFKDAKSIEVTMETSHEDIIPTFSDNNRKWVGIVNSMESKPVSFFIDLRDSVPTGLHNLTFKLNYLDMDNNNYSKEIVVPLKVHSRPNIVVESFTGEGLAGGSGRLEVVIKNIGEDSAEASDVRIVRQSTQPFAFDVRSDYVGELQPGETGKAIFEFDILADAEIKTHDFQLFIRAKGDSDEGDDTIYTFQRRAQFDVTGNAPNWFILVGASVLVLIIIILVLGNFVGRKKKK